MKVHIWKDDLINTKLNPFNGLSNVSTSICEQCGCRLFSDSAMEVWRRNADGSYTRTGTDDCEAEQVGRVLLQ